MWVTVRFFSLAAWCQAVAVGQSAPAVALPHLFMDEGDVGSTRGLVAVTAGVLTYDATLKHPPLAALSPSTAWCAHPYRVAPPGHLCATVVGALPALASSPSPGGFEVYVARSPDPLTVLGCK